MASLPQYIVVTLRLDDRERQAIRDWMGNAQAALATIAAKAPCTHEERARLNALFGAMEEAGAVFWELPESRGEDGK